MSGKAPKWLKRELQNLPAWAKVIESFAAKAGKVSVCIEADTDAYVPEWLELVGVMRADGAYLKDPDQYWLEVAYQCAKMDLQLAITSTEHDPRTSGKSAEFRFTKSATWAQQKFPPGRGIVAATQGREAREHYRRVRGRLPF